MAEAQPRPVLALLLPAATDAGAFVSEYLESYSLDGGGEHVTALVEYYGSEEALEQAYDLWFWLLEGMPQCGRGCA